MKRKTVMSVLLAALLAGTLAACGSKSTQDDASAESTSASETSTSADTADYVDIDDSTGLAIRQWVGSFADCASSENSGIAPWDSMLDAEKGVRSCEIEAIVEDFPEGFDETSITSYEELQQYRSEYWFPEVIFVLDQNLTEEELREILDPYVENADYTLTQFTTESGRVMYQVDHAPTESTEVISEYASEETKALLESMKADWEKQRLQIDYVEYQAASGISFQTVDYDGNTVDSSVFKDAKITMVNIWATTCSFCIEEMPDLQELNDEMEDLQILTLLTDVRSLDDEDGVEEAHDIMSAQKVTLPVLLDTDELDECFPAVGTPTSYLLDQDGNILGRPKVGMASKENYAKWVQDALDQME